MENDIGDDDEVHPSVHQIITIDGQTKEIIMMNESEFPVLIAAGSLVLHARLIEDDEKPSFAETVFDPFEAVICFFI